MRRMTVAVETRPAQTAISSQWFPYSSAIHQDDLKNRMSCTRTIWRIGFLHSSLQIILVKNSQRGKELNTFCPPNRSNDLCLCFCLYPSSMPMFRETETCEPWEFILKTRSFRWNFKYEDDHEVPNKLLHDEALEKTAHPLPPPPYSPLTGRATFATTAGAGRWQILPTTGKRKCNTC